MNCFLTEYSATKTTKISKRPNTIPIISTSKTGSIVCGTVIQKDKPTVPKEEAKSNKASITPQLENTQIKNVPAIKINI